MSVFKRKDFARWQVREGLPDSALCTAVRALERGLVDADLGGFLYKMRVARPGEGKRGGYRLVLAARTAERYVFLHGFAKSRKANVTWDELQEIRGVGRAFLYLPPAELSRVVSSGLLMEVHCGEQTH